MKSAVVCVVAGSGITSGHLVKQLEPLRLELQQPVDFLSLDYSAMPSIFRPETSLVIIDQPWRTADRTELLQQVRDTGYKGPIILIISDISLWAARVRTMPILKGVGFTNRPVDAVELVGLAKRVIQTEGRRFRIFPRHDVDLPATLDFEEGVAQSAECKILNVSHGGACLQLSLSKVSIAPNNIIALNFKLDDETGLQNIRCRVAWVRPGADLVGAEFMHTLNL